MSPTELSLKRLRADGWLAAVVEKWNPHVKIRQDLFGFIDLIAVCAEGTLAIQATSYSNLASRVRKITDSENLGAVREAGWKVEVWGWRKVKNRWQCRIVDIS